MTDAHCITIVAAILRSADMRHHRYTLEETSRANLAYTIEAAAMLKTVQETTPPPPKAKK